MIRIKKGLDIPIYGSPAEEIVDSKKSRSVAILGDDYVGMKPTMLVEEGDQVKLGQPLFEDKKNPGVFITSPAGGKVEAINRGNRRVLQSIVIEVDSQEEFIQFNTFSEQDLLNATQDSIREQLISSGMWTAFRTRPYSKIPDTESSPSNVFISALDTQPLSPNPEYIINLQKEDFNFGISVLKQLVNCPIHLSISENSSLDIKDDDQLKTHVFTGPHPSGLVGTQMHFISPASLSNINWSIGYQDIIAIGKLFKTGFLPVERIISLRRNVTRPDNCRSNNGGEGGIRTLDTLLTYTHFPGVRFQPLSHLSAGRQRVSKLSPRRKPDWIRPDSSGP